MVADPPDFMPDPVHDTSTALNEWSKWITGISLFSASGCVSVLVTKGVGAKNLENIKLAIVFFLVTVVVAWLIQLVLALARPTTSDKASIRMQMLYALIALEILVFLISIFYLARWVWMFPPSIPVSDPTIPSVLV